MYIVYEGFVNTYRIVIVTKVCKHGEKYSIVEYTDIHYMYGRAKGNALEAARLYAETFPNRRHSDSRTFNRMYQLIRENGSFRHKGRPGRPKTLAPDVEERVLERVDVNPGTSTRRVAMQVGIIASSVWRILHHQLMYPYHIQRVQGLKNTDFLIDFLLVDTTECPRSPILKQCFVYTRTWVYPRRHF